MVQKWTACIQRNDPTLVCAYSVHMNRHNEVHTDPREHMQMANFFNKDPHGYLETEHKYLHLQRSHFKGDCFTDGMDSSNEYFKDTLLDIKTYTFH